MNKGDLILLKTSLETEIPFQIEGNWEENYFISTSILLYLEGDLRYKKKLRI